MYKKVRMLFGLTLVIMLTACNAKGIDSTDNALSTEIQTAESAEVPTELPTVEPTEEPTEVSLESSIEKPTEEPVVESVEEEYKAWIESFEEQNAGKYKINSEIEVSIVRTSKPVISETGEVLGNAYYDRPVVSGDSEAAKKINQFFEQEERDWLEGEAGRLTGYYEDYYLSFCDRVASMCETYGEEVISVQPLRYAIDSRIMFLSDELLSVLQIENYFGGHCNWHYYGSTFDLKTGELIPIDTLVDITPSKMKEIVGDAGEMYDVLEGDNYEIDYETDNHVYTIAMNYEYYYDGNHYFIIVNQGDRPGIIQANGEIREWNGEWGDQYKVATFEYTVDLQNERWKKDYY